MLSSKKYQNKNVAIYGMGITGFSAAKTLSLLGANVFCWDDDKIIRKKIKKSKFLLNQFWIKKKFLDNIIISPGIDIYKCNLKKFLSKNLNKIITDIDLFFELNKDSTIISITGTNGKSTTCKIIEKILKTANKRVKTVGNIGNPILFSSATKKKNIFIIEISSYQLQYSKLFRSKYAAILNISPDHLERHKNIKNYIKIKSKIFFAQRSTDYSYINSTNKHSITIKKIYKSKNLKSKLVLVKKNACNFLLKKINNEYIKNQANIDNLNFAYQIVKKLKISEKIIVKALNQFKGLPHRQEIVISNKKILCINDSKATSFDATLQSLANYNNIYWIVGGLPKYKDKFYLKNVKNKIVKAYIVGNSISFFKNEIGKSVPTSISKNMKEAINCIYNDIKLSKKLKKTILLSPAAASYDQYSNFESRGEYFKSIIRKKYKKLFNV